MKISFRSSEANIIGQIDQTFFVGAITSPSFIFKRYLGRFENSDFSNMLILTFAPTVPEIKTKN